MNDSVRVYSENEYGREAADHSADVINGDTACNIFFTAAAKVEERRENRSRSRRLPSAKTIHVVAHCMASHPT